MSKIISAKIGKFYHEKFTKPIRSKKDFVLMLLDTIDALYLGENMIEDAEGTIIVKVSKMSRVFYELGDKMFSLGYLLQNLAILDTIMMSNTRMVFDIL